METANKNVIITKKARENLVKARAGIIELPIITGMAFGDGGVREDNTIRPPEEGQSGLFHELFRKKIDGCKMTADTTCRYECTLSESELADQFISEIALYDANGDIVCIKTFQKKGKDADVEMSFTLDDIF